MNIRYGKKVRFFRQFIKRILAWLFPLIRFIYKFPFVDSIENTLIKINRDSPSVSRFGDGEFLIIIDRLSLPFQNYDQKLREKLINVIKSNINNHLVCLPIGFQRDHSELIPSARIFWRSHLAWIYPRLYKYLNINREYYNASFSRYYITINDRNKSLEYIKLLKNTWNKRQIVIIEGEKSRLGVGNDLFENASEVERILAPAVNAFSKYDEIISFVNSISKSKLILIALGPTATVLAYDLHLNGFNAIDIGNIDIEYEWFLRGSRVKTKIPGKYTSEAVGGRIVDDISDEKYESEIIAKIL